MFEPTKIALLSILAVVSTFYLIKKKKSSKIRKIVSESEEMLNAKKSLLVSVLKEIEKKHRSKQISDDSYHKLRELYKEQAVETIKKLDDIKSEI